MLRALNVCRRKVSPFSWSIEFIIFKLVNSLFDRFQGCHRSSWEKFHDFLKSNSWFKLILKYITWHLKLYKAFNIILIQVKTTVFFLPSSIIKLPLHHLNHLCMIDVFVINSSISKILVLLPYKHSLPEKRYTFLFHNINVSK